MRSNRLTTFIVIGLVLGVIAGYVCHAGTSRVQRAASPRSPRSCPTAFLRLIKMIIAPLVFATLVVGIAKMGDIAHRRPRRRQGARLVHLRLAHLADARPGAGRAVRAGQGDALPLPAADATLRRASRRRCRCKDFITHTIPTSILDAMARNEILQIVVFSLFFGMAMAALGERTQARDRRARCASRTSC